MKVRFDSATMPATLPKGEEQFKPLPTKGGWKSDLLAEWPEYSQNWSCALPAGVLTRRRLLINGVGVAAGLATYGLIRPRKSEAGILTWALATVVASAIGWVVGKALDTLWESRTVRKVSNPRPSRSAFHNQFADPYVVPHWKDHIADRYLPRYGVSFGLREQLRLHEMNADEINCIRVEVERGLNRMVLPTGLRRPLSSYDHRDLALAEKAYGTQIDPHQVKYVRDFTNDRRSPQVGFAVARGGKSQLLLV